MRKEPLIISLVMIVLIAITYGAYSFNNANKQAVVKSVNKKFDKNSFIYFFGATCPHCKELSDWLKKEGIDKKLKYEKLEVYYSEENAALMQKAAEVCKLDAASGMGVPFVYFKGKCAMGTPDAQKIFKQQFDKKNIQ